MEGNEEKKRLEWCPYLNIKTASLSKAILNTNSKSRRSGDDFEKRQKTNGVRGGVAPTMLKKIKDWRYRKSMRAAMV